MTFVHEHLSIATDGLQCRHDTVLSSVTDGLLCAPADVGVVPERDPTTPLHVRDLSSGMTLRIALRAGRHVNASRGRSDRGGRGPTRGSGIVWFSPRRRRGRGERVSGESALPHSRTTFTCYVLSNDPGRGLLTVNLEDRSRSGIIRAIINYADIASVRRYVAQPAGAYPEAGSRPGSVGLGSRSVYGFMKLVRVKL